MTLSDQDTEHILTAGDLRASVSPWGAAHRGVWRELPGGGRREIVTSYSGAHNKAGGQGDILIPFPGRVKGGTYTFEGRQHQMEQNDKESPSAIHGFLRSVPWTVTELQPAAATFTVSMGASDYPGYPFALAVTVEYALTEAGLTCRYEIRNAGDATAPVAAGFHPYFSAGSDTIDSCTLHVPMASVLEFDGLLPTGGVLPVQQTPFDFRSPRPIGGTKLNTCFLDPERDPDGKLRVTLANDATGESLAVWMDRSINYVVLYSGDPLPETHRRKSLAIEPMTCASDAFNHPEWGLVTLKPGESTSGEWGVESTSAAR